MTNLATDLARVMLLNCPFCGNDVNDDEGCFQVAGFRQPSTPAFSVRCGNPSCSADVTAPSREAAITAWNTRAASGGDSASLEQRAMEFAREQLQRHVDMLLQECDCEECPECGKLPHECSGTTCAQTCQCTTCDHCSAVDAIDSLAAALANQQGGGEGCSAVSVAA